MRSSRRRTAVWYFSVFDFHPPPRTSRWIASTRTIRSLHILVVYSAARYSKRMDLWSTLLTLAIVPTSVGGFALLPSLLSVGFHGGRCRSGATSVDATIRCGPNSCDIKEAAIVRSVSRIVRSSRRQRLQRCFLPMLHAVFSDGER